MNPAQNVLTRESSQKCLPEPLRSWAGRRTEYPRQKTVTQLFEEVVTARPTDVAVIFGETRLTYCELNARANRLASRLRHVGVGPDTMVGVCLERSAEMIVALVGVLKAGGAYVPFDPAYPRERLDFMLADTRTPVMVTQKSLASIALNGPDICSVLMDEYASAASTEDHVNPPLLGSAMSLAYVMYTSGSTGRPKGVLVENRSIVRLVFNTNFCRFGPDEVILQAAPISFDASTFEIWGALLHGAKLFVMPPQSFSLEDLGRAIREHGVTTLWLTAGLFNLFVDERMDDLRSLKQLLAGGDALSVTHVRRALENLPNVTLINGYGPTEGTTFTCCHVMRHGDFVPDSVPIGTPISNSFVYVLDEQLRPVPAGTPGELCAGGDGIARGYLNSPGATAEKFVPDPFSEEPGAQMYRTGDLARWREDGSVEFLGRMDNQVKILGHRIEPGEIEAAFSQFSGIRQVCVVAHTDEGGTRRLVAYYVAVENTGIADRELREFLSVKLPAYMVPSFFVSLAALPLDPNGKVDRAALPGAVVASSESRVYASGSPSEQAITAVWKRVLRIESAGLDDNFFDLGGDSLLLVAVHSQLQKLLQFEIPVMDLFEFTTIRALAQHLSDSVAAEAPFTAQRQQAQKQREAFARRRVVKGSSI